MYYNETKTLSKLNIDKVTLLSWRAQGHIVYSSRTDKYDIDSVLGTRTMTLGLEKYLTPEVKLDLEDKMKKQSSFIRYLFSQGQNNNNEIPWDVNEVDKLGQRDWGLNSHMAASAYGYANGKIKATSTLRIKEIESIQTKLLRRGSITYKNTLRTRLSRLQSQPHKSIHFGGKLSGEERSKKRMELVVQGQSNHKGNGSIRLYTKDGLHLKIWKYKIPFNTQDIPSSHRSLFLGTLDSFNRQSMRINYNAKGKLVLNVTYYYVKKPVNHKNQGTIGIDIGPKEITCCLYKNDDTKTYLHFNTSDVLDKSGPSSVSYLSTILDKILKIAVHLNYSITVENLKFKREYNYSSKLNRMLSKFPSVKFMELISSKAARNGIKLILVNPAYTSVIGLFKYASSQGLDIEHNSNSKDLSAALVIARRGLRRKEKARVVVRQQGRLISIPIKALIPESEKDGNKSLYGDTNSNWSLWARLKKSGFRKPSDLTGPEYHHCNRTNDYTCNIIDPNSGIRIGENPITRLNGIEPSIK